MICPIRIFKVPDDLPEVVDSPGLHVRRSKYVEGGACASYIPEGIVGAGGRSLIGPDYRPHLPWSIDDCTAVHVVHRGRNRADCAWAVDRSRSVRIRLYDGIGVRDRGVVNVVVDAQRNAAPVCVWRALGIGINQKLVHALAVRPEILLYSLIPDRDLTVSLRDPDRRWGRTYQRDVAGNRSGVCVDARTVATVKSNLAHKSVHVCLDCKAARAVVGRVVLDVQEDDPPQ